MSAVLTRYFPLLLLAAAWEAVTRAGLVPASALPSLDKVAEAWWGLAAGGDL
jgi:ABC-type nitrate/sulfonate/bicarbonate transport system permease component